MVNDTLSNPRDKITAIDDAIPHYYNPALPKIPKAYETMNLLLWNKIII